MFDSPWLLGCSLLNLRCTAGLRVFGFVITTERLFISLLLLHFTQLVCSVFGCNVNIVAYLEAPNFFIFWVFADNVLCWTFDCRAERSIAALVRWPIHAQSRPKKVRLTLSCPFSFGLSSQCLQL